MKDKTKFGRACEDFVAELIAIKTGLEVSNLNDVKNNHPATDLRIAWRNKKPAYEVSVKAKKNKVWPAVKGVSKKHTT